MAWSERSSGSEMMPSTSSPGASTGSWYSYDYPGSETLTDGAMGHMMGILVPDDLSDFPELDRSADIYHLDFTNLPAGELHVDGAIGRHAHN